MKVLSYSSRKFDEHPVASPLAPQTGSAYFSPNCGPSSVFLLQLVSEKLCVGCKLSRGLKMEIETNLSLGKEKKTRLGKEKREKDTSTHLLRVARQMYLACGCH